MITQKIRLSYRLSEPAYRAEVAAGAGPVHRDRQVLIAAFLLRADARLALLDARGLDHWPLHDHIEAAITRGDDEITRGTPLADREVVAISLREERAAEPTVADAEAALLGLADACRRAAEARRARDERIAERAAADEAALTAWVEAAEGWPTARAGAFLRSPGAIPAPIEGLTGWRGHGDGYGWPASLRERVRALYDAAVAERAAERRERERLQAEADLANDGLIGALLDLDDRALADQWQRGLLAVDLAAPAVLREVWRGVDLPAPAFVGAERTRDADDPGEPWGNRPISRAQYARLAACRIEPSPVVLAGATVVYRLIEGEDGDPVVEIDATWAGRVWRWHLAL